MNSHIFSFVECGHRMSKHFSRTNNKKKYIYYFKGLLMTHHLDIFMSGKKTGIKRVNML